MRRLRNRLRQYYLNEGSADPLVITLQPGTYVPRFEFKAEAADGQGKIAIAILPFEGPKEDADLGGALREAIFARLAQSSLLRVIAHDSVGALPGSSPASWTIGQDLPGSLVLCCKCLRGSDSARVLAELRRAEGGELLWSGVYGQELDAEIWTIQDQIASDLEKAAAAYGPVPSRPAPSVVQETGIQRLIVQGRYYLNQASATALEKSKACFEAALERQPASAQAWAGLSVTHSLLVVYHSQPSVPGWKEAKAAAGKALFADPMLSEAHTAMGLWTAFSEFKPASAARHLERACALNPQDTYARLVKVMACLTPLGQLEQAEDELETVLGSDPLNPKALQMLAAVLYFQRRFDVAVEVALSALDVLPGSALAWFVLANAYDKLGNYEEALSAFRHCEELIPFLRSLHLPTALTAIYKGHVHWVKPVILAAAKLLQSSPTAPSPLLADLMIRIGEYERAVSWMERGFAQREFRALFLRVDPAFDAIRSHPRCAGLLGQLGTEAEIKSLSAWAV
ncbi:MAG: tetratricopeptide repeat protein [Acidobacteriia bacterium]|nr:tetratricopeptide repeat protein [Terriglobia bacterium]